MEKFMRSRLRMNFYMTVLHKYCRSFMGYLLRSFAAVCLPILLTILFIEPFILFFCAILGKIELCLGPEIFLKLFKCS